MYRWQGRDNTRAARQPCLPASRRTRPRVRKILIKRTGQHFPPDLETSRGASRRRHLDPGAPPRPATPRSRGVCWHLAQAVLYETERDHVSHRKGPTMCAGSLPVCLISIQTGSGIELLKSRSVSSNPVPGRRLVACPRRALIGRIRRRAASKLQDPASFLWPCISASKDLGICHPLAAPKCPFPNSCLASPSPPSLTRSSRNVVQFLETIRHCALIPRMLESQLKEKKNIFRRIDRPTASL